MPDERRITRSDLMDFREELVADLAAVDRVIGLFDRKWSSDGTPRIEPPASRPALPSPEASRPARDVRQRVGNLINRVETAVAQLPRQFTNSQVIGSVQLAIGQQVNRTSVRNCLDQLQQQRKIAVLNPGGPGQAAVYQRLDGVENDAA